MNYKVNVIGEVVLYLRIIETDLHLVFRILKNVALRVLLEASLIDERLYRVFPAEKEILTYKSQPVPLPLDCKALDHNQATTGTTKVIDGSALALKTYG